MHLSLSLDSHFFPLLVHIGPHVPATSHQVPELASIRIVTQDMPAEKKQKQKQKAHMLLCRVDFLEKFALGSHCVLFTLPASMLSAFPMGHAKLVTVGEGRQEQRQR